MTYRYNEVDKTRKSLEIARQRIQMEVLLMKKNILVAGLVAMLSVASVVPVFAEGGAVSFGGSSVTAPRAMDIGLPIETAPGPSSAMKQVLLLPDGL